MFEWFVQLFQQFIAFIMSLFETLGLYSPHRTEEPVQLVPPVPPMQVEPSADF